MVHPDETLAPVEVRVYLGGALGHAAKGKYLFAQHHKLLKVTTDDQGPLVGLLHGFAGRPEDLEPFARSIGVAGRFRFPEGFEDLTPLGLSGRGWWPSGGVGRSAAMARERPRDLSEYEPAELQRAHDALSALLDELVDEAPGAPLVLGGFSQGAMLAFDVALRSTRSIAALVQLSGAPIARRLGDRGSPCAEVPAHSSVTAEATAT